MPEDGGTDAGADGGIKFVPSIARMIKDTGVHLKMVMAHRGGAGEAPENTMGAYRNAEKMGVSSIEVDTALTKDGVIVMFHDDTLDKATDCTGPLAEKTYDELKKCTVTICCPGQFEGERYIPTIDETFSYLKGKTLINLDAKGVGPELLVPKIREYGLEDQVIYQTGSTAGCVGLEASFPGIFCLPKASDVADLEEAAASCRSNLVEFNDIPDYNEETIAAAKRLGLKTTVDVMESVDLYPRPYKIRFMREGIDMVQSDLPAQWIPVIDFFNR